MSRTHTAVPAKPHNEAVGMAIAGVVATGISVVVIPLTLVVAAVVYSSEVVPRVIHAVARLFGKDWAQ